VDEKGVVHVDIFGSQYTIKKGSEDSDYIVRVAEYVDHKMREINEKLPVASVAKVAVLASLNLADELFKERDGKVRDDQAMDRLAKSSRRLEALLDSVE